MAGENANSPVHGKRLLAAFFALLLGMGLAIWLSRGLSEGAASNGANRSSPIGLSQEPGRNSTTPPAPEATHIEGEPSGAAPDQATVKPGDKDRTVRIRVYDIATGDPVANTRFVYGYSTTRELLSARPSVGRPALSHAMLTDERGIAEIAIPYSAVALLASDADEWAIVRDTSVTRDFDSRLGPGLIVVGRVHSQEEYAVGCREATSVVVRVIYADGLPAKGSVSYTLWKEQPVRYRRELILHSARGLAPDDRGLVVIPNVPVDSYIVVSANGNRPGWAAQANVSQAVEATTREIPVVFAEQEQNGSRLYLSFLGVPEDAALRVQVIDEYGFKLASFTQRSSGHWTSNPMPETRRVRIHVEGAMVWESDEIDLSDPSATKIEVRPEKPATALLHVVDESGQAVTPAVALRYANRLVSWEDPGKYATPVSMGAYASADSGGVIRIEGLAPGSRALTVQAKGFEARTVSFIARAGEVTELGEVRLRRYAGEEGTVRVRIRGSGEFRGLVCGIMAYGSGTICTPVRVPDNGELVFQDLHYGRYVLFAHSAATKRTIWQQAFEMTPESPKAELELDVSKPPQRNPQPD